MRNSEFLIESYDISGTRFTRVKILIADNTAPLACKKGLRRLCMLVRANRRVLILGSREGGTVTAFWPCGKRTGEEKLESYFARRFRARFVPRASGATYFTFVESV